MDQFTPCIQTKLMTLPLECERYSSSYSEILNDDDIPGEWGMGTGNTPEEKV